MPSRHWGDVDVQLYPYSSSALEGSGWLKSGPGLFYPRKEIQTTLNRRLGGPRSRSGWVWKICFSPGLEPRTIELVAGCHTDYAVPSARLPYEVGDFLIYVATSNCLKRISLIALHWFKSKYVKWYKICLKMCLEMKWLLKWTQVSKNLKVSATFDIGLPYRDLPRWTPQFGWCYFRLTAPSVNVFIVLLPKSFQQCAQYM